jgi:hypothetical protein
VALPKSVIRYCREIGLINEEQTEMIITMAEQIRSYDG